MRYLDAEINRLIAQTKSPVFHNVLMDLRDLRKLARTFLDLDPDQLREIEDSPAPFGNPFTCLISRVAVLHLADCIDALKAHLEAKQ